MKIWPLISRHYYRNIYTLLGLLLGRWLAGTAVAATAETVETFYIAEVARAGARADA